MTALAQVLFPTQANGSLLQRERPSRRLPTSRAALLLPRLFPFPPICGRHRLRRLAVQSGSNLGPTNHQLLDRVKADVEKLQAESPNVPVPVDLVTTSGSGLDPEISPAAAQFQIPRIARERGISEAEVRSLVAKHTLPRQLGVLGEPRVRVLELNLDLDATHPKK